MAKPEHLAAVKSVVGVFARDVVGTYLAGPSAAQRAAQQAQEQQAAAMQAAAVERPRGAPRAQLRCVGNRAGGTRCCSCLLLCASWVCLLVARTGC